MCRKSHHFTYFFNILFILCPGITRSNKHTFDWPKLPDLHPIFRRHIHCIIFRNAIHLVELIKQWQHRIHTHLIQRMHICHQKIVSDWLPKSLHCFQMLCAALLYHPQEFPAHMPYRPYLRYFL